MLKEAWVRTRLVILPGMMVLSAVLWWSGTSIEGLLVSLAATVPIIVCGNLLVIYIAQFLRVRGKSDEQS
jgi:hypothetical protein